MILQRVLTPVRAHTHSLNVEIRNPVSSKADESKRVLTLMVKRKVETLGTKMKEAKPLPRAYDKLRREPISQVVDKRLLFTSSTGLHHLFKQAALSTPATFSQPSRVPPKTSTWLPKWFSNGHIYEQPVRTLSAHRQLFSSYKG
jgi:hypothetical protein